MKKIMLFVLVVFSLLVLTGCSKTVEEITGSDDFVDKTVSVKGTAEGSIKFGELSGYTLTDKNGDKIIISTKDLPDEGEKVTAKGTLKKGLLGIGFYIDEK